MSKRRVENIGAISGHFLYPCLLYQVPVPGLLYQVPPIRGGI